MKKNLILENLPTFYEIYDTGTIININTGKKLKGYINNNGYVSMYLTNGLKEKKNYSLHRLVAQHFIDNPNNFPIVNHIDGDKLNNNKDNLEWTNQKYNAQHAMDNNLNKKAYGKRNKIDINIYDGNWKQYLNTNYYVNKKGQCYNSKTHILLKETPNSAGYIRYNLRINNKTVTVFAHTLVINVWGQQTIKMDEVINHKDGNKANNDINNLEIISKKENMLHACYTLNKNIIPVVCYSLQGDFVQEYPSISEAAKNVGRSPAAICRALKNNATSAGYKWFYKSEKFND